MTQSFYDYQLYVFDLDGTLLDSSPDVVDSINEVLEHFGKPKGSDQAIRYSIGGEMDKIFSSALEDTTGFDMDLAIETFIEIYHKNCANKSTFFPHATELLTKLKKMNKHIALFTTKDNKDTNKVLEHLGMKDMFEVIVARQDVQEPKPHPEGLHKVLEYFPKVSKEDVIMIGDTYYDLMSGTQAKVDTLIVQHGYDLNVLNHDVKPTRYIKDFKELLEN